MQENPSLLPSLVGAEEAPLASCKPADKSRALRRLRYSVAARRPSASFWSALAVAILLGAALGLEFGIRAGGLAPLTSGRAAQTESLDRAALVEVARLRDDVRSLRAQIEQLRHAVESSRAAERIKALETAHEASFAREQLASATATKLGALEARLERLERAGADASPTSVIRRPGSKQWGKDRRAAGGGAPE